MKNIRHLEESTKNLKDILLEIKGAIYTNYGKKINLVCPKHVKLYETPLNNHFFKNLKEVLKEIIELSCVSLQNDPNTESPLYVNVWENKNKIEIKINCRFNGFSNEEIQLFLCPFYRKINHTDNTTWTKLSDLNNKINPYNGRITIIKNESIGTISITFNKRFC